MKTSTVKTLLAGLLLTMAMVVGAATSAQAQVRQGTLKRFIEEAQTNGAKTLKLQRGTATPNTVDIANATFEYSDFYVVITYRNWRHLVPYASVSSLSAYSSEKTVSVYLR